MGGIFLEIFRDGGKSLPYVESGEDSAYGILLETLQRKNRTP